MVVPILKVSITKGGSVYEMRARRYEEEWKGETLSFLSLSFPTSEWKNDMILIFILSILYSFDVVFRSFTFEYLVTIKNYNNDTNN